MKKKRNVISALAMVIVLLASAGCQNQSEGIVTRKTEAGTETETAGLETGTDEAARMESEEASAAAQQTEAQAGLPGEPQAEEENDPQTGTSQPDGAQQTGEQRDRLKKELGIPDVFTAYPAGIDTAKYTTKAEVILPDEDSFISVPVKRQAFTEEDFSWIEALFLSGGLYVRDEETAAALDGAEGTVWRLREVLQEPEKYSESELEILKGQLEWTEAKREQILQNEERIPVPLQFVTEEKMEGTGAYITSVNGLTDWERGTMSFHMTPLGFGVSPENSLNQNSCTISEETAQKTADDLVEKMGLSDTYVLASVEKTPVWEIEAAYTFHYTPEIEGAAARYCRNSFPQELRCSLDISVDDQGIQAVLCDAGYVIQEDQAPTPIEGELVPFMTIKAVYESVMPDVIAQLEQNYAEQRLSEWKGLVSVSVDQVRLAYVMYGSTEGEAGVLSPVWEFYGTVTALNEDGEEKENIGYRLLTIDALTGSPIGM
ncbi:MAG TPA: hypothetical protein H9672_08580 [Firmicutes bacterium]|nr:hypothetical protein [Bacillota bacterium]